MNSSFHIKKTSLINNSINNQNIFFKIFYNTIGNINKTYDNSDNKNVILNMNSGKNNNKSKIKHYLIYKPLKNKNKLNDSKKQFVIKPYIQLKQNNNNFKNKLNLNNSIRVNKKNINACEDFPQKQNLKSDEIYSKTITIYCKV